MNNKDANQTVKMHMLVYTFVVHMQQIRFSHGKVLIKKTKKKVFCGFSMGSNQYWAGRVYDLCVYFMKGTESGFMEKLRPNIGNRYQAGFNKSGISPFNTFKNINLTYNYI